MESDQFLVWQLELKDSGPALNTFVNERFRAVLEGVNRRGRLAPCEKLPPILYRDLQRTLVTSRLRRFLHRSQEIDVYPPRSVGYWEYRKQSVFRRKAFPFFLPLSRTIRVGDVYLGTDKLGHMFGFGRRYAALYRRARRRGASDEEARRRMVLRGLKQERWFVGGLVDGIVSNGDLEANYQGFRLVQDLCGGEAPFLARGENGWRLTRAVDLRDYVNPGFDESYNANHFFAYRWRVVRPVLKAEICGRLDGPRVRRRFERYRAIDRPSFSRLLVAERNREKGRKSNHEFSAIAVCEAQRVS